MFLIFLFCSCLVCSGISIFWRSSNIWITPDLRSRHATENILYELINGMSDIKINNAQETQIAQWESNQNHINEIALKGLILGNKQTLGGSAITKACEIIILGLCAVMTIQSDITIGTLICINYILGQLSSALASMLRIPRTCRTHAFHWQDLPRFNLRKMKIRRQYQNYA